MKLNCNCKGKIEKAEAVENGFLVPCLKCNKCGKTYFSSEQAKHLIRLREEEQTA